MCQYSSLKTQEPLIDIFLIKLIKKTDAVKRNNRYVLFGKEIKDFQNTIVF